MCYDDDQSQKKELNYVLNLNIRFSQKFIMQIEFRRERIIIEKWKWMFVIFTFCFYITHTRI